MKAVLDGVAVSPVNMEERANLGIRPGDTVRVHQKIQEKGKTRIQVFEGLVLSRKHGTEPGATFTVRKVASGIGVEKIFPLYSPLIDKIEIVKRAKVRRAKLYYIREKVNREIKRQMRRMSLMSLATESGAEAAAREAEEEAAKAAEAEAAKQAKEAEAAETAETVDETPAEEAATEDKTETMAEEAPANKAEEKEAEAKDEETEEEKTEKKEEPEEKKD